LGVDEGSNVGPCHYGHQRKRYGRDEYPDRNQGDQSRRCGGNGEGVNRAESVSRHPTSSN